MRKVLIAVLMTILLLSFTGCESNQEIINVKSETTDYAMLNGFNLLIGEDTIDIEAKIENYCQQNINDFSKVEYIGKQKIVKEKIFYTVECRTNIGQLIYHLVYFDVLNNKVEFIFQSDKAIKLNFIYGNYLYITETVNYFTTQYCFINLKDLSRIELAENNLGSRDIMVSEEGKLYEKKEETNGILVTFYDFQNNSLVKKEEYLVSYKGYNSFTDFLVYDDCVVTNKFIFDFATQSYDFCLYTHNICKGRYFNKISYVIEDNDGVISTATKQSVIYLDACKFLEKSEAELENDKILYDAYFISSDKERELILKFVGYNENLSMSMFKKNSFTKALINEKCKFHVESVDGNKIFIVANSLYVDNENDVNTVSGFIYDIENDSITILGTMSSTTITSYPEIWEVV